MDDLYIALYLRISVATKQLEESNNRESYSISNQRKLMLDFVNQNFKIMNNHIYEFIDDGYTGRDFERPGFKKMMDLVKKRKINIIIVKDLSRLGRNYLEVGSYIEQIFPFLGVRFIAINDNFDSNSYEGSGSRLDISMKYIINEMYSKDASEKVKKVMINIRKQGKFLGVVAPYGYKKSNENKHNLVVDNEAANIVKKIFNMAANGTSQIQICEYLNDMNISPPGKYLKQKNCYYSNGSKLNNTIWTRQCIHRILENPVYIGKMCFGRYQEKNQNLPMNEWIIVKGYHEPIIDEFTFDIVKKRREELTKKIKITKKRSPNTIFAGKFYCGRCQKTLKRRLSGGKNSRNRKAYFYCSTKKCCNCHIEEEYLKEIILVAINQQFVGADNYQKSFIDKYAVSDCDKIAKKIEDIDIKISDINNLKMENYINYRSGDIEYQTFFDNKNRYNENISVFEKIKSEMELKLHELQHSLSDNEYLKNFAGKTKVKKLDREIIQLLIHRIYFFEKDKINIIWNYSDQYKEILNLIDD